MNKRSLQLYEYGLVFLFFLTWGFIFLDRLAVSHLMPTLVQDLNLTIAFAVFGPPIAALSDRTGYRKRFLILAVLATGIFAALSSIASSYTSLLLLRILVGASEGPILALLMTMLAASSSQGRFGRNAGIVNAGVTVIAITLGPTLVTWLASYTNWRLSFLLVSVPTFILTIIIWKYVQEVSHKITDADVEKKGKMWTGYIQALKYRNIKICILVAICFSSGYWMLNGFGPLYLTEVSQLSVRSMGLTLSALGLIAIVWTVIVPMLSDYIGRKSTLIFFSLLFVIGPLFMYLSPGWGISLAVLILLGGILGALAPIFMNIIPVESVPANLSATSSALIIGTGEIIGALVLGLGGTLSDSYGLSIIMILMLSASLLLAIVSIGLKETHPRVLKKNKEVTL